MDNSENPTADPEEIDMHFWKYPTGVIMRTISVTVYCDDCEHSHIQRIILWKGLDCLDN